MNELSKCLNRILSKANLLKNNCQHSKDLPLFAFIREAISLWIICIGGEKNLKGPFKLFENFYNESAIRFLKEIELSKSADIL